jgi:hypothetical protein
VRSNSTLGTVINSVRSARLNTNGSKSITYGRVEVVARLPAGDWLWPAICEHLIPCRSSSRTDRAYLVYDRDDAYQ